MSNSTRINVYDEYFLKGYDRIEALSGYFSDAANDLEDEEFIGSLLSAQNTSAVHGTLSDVAHKYARVNDEIVFGLKEILKKIDLLESNETVIADEDDVEALKILREKISHLWDLFQNYKFDRAETFNSKIAPFASKVLDDGVTLLDAITALKIEATKVQNFAEFWSDDLEKQITDREPKVDKPLFGNTLPTKSSATPAPAPAPALAKEKTSVLTAIRSKFKRPRKEVAGVEFKESKGRFFSVWKRSTRIAVAAGMSTLLVGGGVVVAAASSDDDIDLEQAGASNLRQVTSAPDTSVVTIPAIRRSTTTTTTSTTIPQSAPIQATPITVTVPETTVPTTTVAPAPTKPKAAKKTSNAPKKTKAQITKENAKKRSDALAKKAAEKALADAALQKAFEEAILKGIAEQEKNKPAVIPTPEVTTTVPETTTTLPEITTTVPETITTIPETSTTVPETTTTTTTTIDPGLITNSTSETITLA